MADLPLIREMFANALECASEAERQAYLDRVCASAPAVRKRVEELLRAHEGNAIGFVEKLGPDLLASDPNRTAAHESIDDTPGSNPHQTTPADPRLTAHYEPEIESPAKSRIGETIGGYALIQKLGDGGMGTVYLGEKRDGKEVLRVAIKLIKPDRVNPHLVARFKAERRILTRLNHGNIAKVFDMGVLVDESVESEVAVQEPYFIMEYVADHDVPAHTLDGYCAAHKLSIDERLTLFEAVCRGVEHAHSSGVIHRDLKGLNVLVAVPRNGLPVPKVIDFGLAKALEDDQQDESELTAPGSFMGTPAYVSPEQASGDVGIGPRTDVYALGVILYKLLTGALPIDLTGVRSHFEMVRRVREEIPPLPSFKVNANEPGLAKAAAERRIEPARLPSLLRGDLDWVVKKTLEKDPAIRYATAGALAEEVRRVLDGEPVEAGPDSRWHRLKKFVRRNRALVTASSVVFFTLIVGLVGLFIGLMEVNAAKDKETAAKIQAEDAEEVERRAVAISWAGIRAQVRSGEVIDEDRKEIYRNMSEELRRLVHENPEASRKRREIGAETSFRLANLAAILGIAAAESLYEEAIRKYQSLDAEFPGTQEYPNELARCHYDLAQLYLSAGRITDAIAEFRIAIKSFAVVVASAPGEAAYRGELADAWNDLGVALKRAKWLSDAESAFRIAIEQGEKAAAQNASRAAYRVNLAMSYHNLGNVIRDQGKPKESIDAYKKASAFLRPLALAWPEGGKSKEASRVLVDTLWDRANARGQLDIYHDSYRDWDAAWQLNNILKFHPFDQLDRFRAAAELEMKFKGQIPTAEAYLAAKINARAFAAATATNEPTLQKQYAKRMLDLLMQAKAGGVFRDEKNVAAFKSEADFTSLPGELLAAFLSSLPAPSVPKK